MKATGTITAVDGDTLAVALQAASIDVADLTATLTADTQYRDAGQPTATRPALAVGEAVAFGAIAQPDGSYLVGVLETHSPEPVAPSDPPIAPGVASADSGSKATLNDGWIKANGTISALDGDSVSVDVDEASVDIATASLTLTAATTYVDAGAAVPTRPELAVGDAIAFVGTAQPDGSYLVDHLEHDLLDTPHVTPDADTAAADAAKRAHVLADCTATTPG
jgi:hypothetical protein